MFGEYTFLTHLEFIRIGRWGEVGEESEVEKCESEFTERGFLPVNRSFVRAGEAKLPVGTRRGGSVARLYGLNISSCVFFSFALLDRGAGSLPS